MQPSPGPNMLQGVRVVGARGLPKRDWFAKSDPYFIARIGVPGSNWSDKIFQVKSNVVRNSLNPGDEALGNTFSYVVLIKSVLSFILEWNAEFAFDKEDNPIAKVAAEWGCTGQGAFPQLELVIQVWGKATILVNDNNINPC